MFHGYLFDPIDLLFTQHVLGGISIYYVLDLITGTGTYEAEQDRHCKLHKDRDHIIARGNYHPIDSSLSYHSLIFFPFAS